MSKFDQLDCEKVWKLAREERLPIKQIAHRFGVCRTLIHKAIKIHSASIGAKRPTGPELRAKNPILPLAMRGMRVAQICPHVGKSQTAVTAMIRDLRRDGHNIPRPT